MIIMKRTIAKSVDEGVRVFGPQYRRSILNLNLMVSGLGFEVYVFFFFWGGGCDVAIN